MGIKCIVLSKPATKETFCEVSCQECEETIVLKNWRDAEKYGWSVPSDGHIHMCPACSKIHMDTLKKNSISVEEYRRRKRANESCPYCFQVIGNSNNE